MRGAGASTPALASGGGGEVRHPLGQGSLGLSQQSVRISAGALGALHSHSLVTICLFLHLPRGDFPLDQRLLSHPRMDSGALAFGKVPRASSELGRSVNSSKKKEGRRGGRGGEGKGEKRAGEDQKHKTQQNKTEQAEGSWGHF